ncbi:MAG: hypothetical protein DRN04_09980 [Thermoprotei archaeon]|nr:MAG: hypothetical protein DRN04_09980 [Thermoprotei archaeon]
MLEGYGYRFYKTFLEEHEEKLRSFIDLCIKARIKMHYKAYIGLAFSLPFIVLAVSLAVLIVLHVIFLKAPLLLSILLGIMLSLVLSLSCLMAMIAYPLYRVSERRRRIERNLLYTVSYMTVLAAGGASLEHIIERVAEVEPEKEIKNEFEGIVKSVKVLGYDLPTALTIAADRSPSSIFARILTGLKETALTSGDLRSYLNYLTSTMIREKETKLETLVDTLSFLSEIYIAAMVAAPVIFILLFVLMSMIGGGVFGLDPIVLTVAVILIYMPSASLIMYLLYDSTISQA